MVSILGFQIGAIQLAALGAIGLAFVATNLFKSRGGLSSVAPLLGRLLPVIAAGAVIYLGTTATGGLFGLNNRQMAAPTEVTASDDRTESGGSDRCAGVPDRRAAGRTDREVHRGSDTLYARRRRTTPGVAT